jgi:hypothetical protein
VKKLPKNIRIRAVAAPAIGVLLASVFSLGSGTSASASEVGTRAHPSGCHYEVAGYWGAVASCSSNNGGSYAATVGCKFPNGKIVDYDGPWKKRGKSIAYCQGDSKAVYAGIWTRVTP